MASEQTASRDAKARKPTLIHWLQYLVMVAICRTITFLPYGLSANIALVAGALCARIFPVRRGVIMENLRIAFGESISGDERKRLAREAYKSMALLGVETLYLTFKGPAWIASVVKEIRGREHLDAVRASGKVPIFASGHLGSWELCGSHLASIIPAAGLAKPMHNPLIQELLHKTRESCGAHVILTGDVNPARAVLRAIKNGLAMGFLADQDMRGLGIFVNFFGVPASTSTGPGYFALKFDVPILPVYAVRSGHASHRIEVYPPIFPSEARGETEEEKIVDLTQRFTNQLEDMVRLYPAQYFWFHRRWKSTPDSVARRKEALEERRKKRLARKVKPAESQIDL